MSVDPSDKSISCENLQSWNTVDILRLGASAGEVAMEGGDAYDWTIAASQEGGRIGGIILSVVGVAKAAKGTVGGEVAGAEVSVGGYRYAPGAARHFSEITRTGQLARPYMRSRLLIDEIMSTGKATPDPRGISGALKYKVPGTLAGRKGVWDLVIDPKTKTIYHFMFKGIK